MKTAKNLKVLVVVAVAVIALAVTLVNPAKTLFAAPPAAQAASNYLLGDVDRDGTVSAMDARFVLRASVDLETIEEGSELFTLADFNKDGAVDATDARLILRASVELEEIPSEEITTEKVYADGDIGRPWDEFEPITASPTPPKPEKQFPPYDEQGHKICEYCGKRVDLAAEHDYEHCNGYYGGCDKWMMDRNCPDCGEFIPAHTCHTCK